MTRAALYARISQDEHGLEKGVQRQLEDARALAAVRGWELTEEFVDNDVSAFSGAHRAGYQRLLRAAAGGDVDRIVVYATSRLWRSRVERAEALEVLAKRRVGVAAVRGPELDLASASGRMVAGILGEFDTAESAIKSERVARAALQRAQEGRANGPVAYGWRRERLLDHTGRAVGFRDVEDPENASVVREIVERLLSGGTLRGIADDLQARGVTPPSGKAGVIWRHTTVRKLAIRPANIGLRVHQGEVIGDAEWPAIVDRDSHDRVCALLTDPTRRLSRDGQRQHLLTYGIGECGVCGAVLRIRRARTKSSPGRIDVEYYCDRAGCVGRSQERVDEFMRAVVVERLSRPDAADVLMPHAPDTGAARARADDLRERLNRAAGAYAAGDIDGEQLAIITRDLRPQLDAAERELARTLRALDRERLAPVLTARTPGEAWDALDVVGRRALLEALGVTVRIMPTRRGPGFRPDDVKIAWGSPESTA